MTKIAKIMMSLGLILILTGCKEPAFTLNGDPIVTVEALTDYVDQGVTSDKDLIVTVDNRVDTSAVGSYIVTYSAKIGSKIKSLYRTVNVVDTVAPILTLKGYLSHYACSLNSYVEEGYTALDNLDGDLNAQVTIAKTTTGLIYSVRDGSGNLAEITRLFNVKDTQKPSISLRGSSSIKMDRNGTYYEFGYNVSDNCGNVSKAVRITTNLDPSVLGHYTVTYTVTDTSGNTNAVTRAVEVADLPMTKVYLTFDDGPDYNTISVLNTLKKYNVKATFFVLWHYGNYGGLIKQAYDEGHTIGLHSYTHSYTNIYSSTDAFFSDLNKISDYVYNLTGYRSMIYRFPGGSSNTVSWFNRGIMTTLAKMVLDQGYHYFDWNVSSGDTATYTEAGIVNNVIRQIKVGGSNIVLMHDGPNRQLSALALPHILDYLRSINAVCLPITMDTPQYHHRIAN